MAEASSHTAHKLISDLSLKVAKTRVDIHQMVSSVLQAGHHHNTGGEGEHQAHGHDNHSFLEEYKIMTYHFIIDVFNLVGVGILCFAAVGIIPELVKNIIPAMFWRVDPHLGHGRYLKARMQLGRGIMLAMDFMVASDILETLLGTPGIWNLIKILCIVAVRSWLAYERSKEVTEMEKEYHHWEKTLEEQDALSMEGSFHGSERSLLSSLSRAGSSRSLQRGDSFTFAQHGALSRLSDLGGTIESTFRELDKDKDGFIVEAELRASLDKMGISVSDVKVKNMMGGRDQMSFDVFNTFIRRMALAESFAESIAEVPSEEEDSSFDNSDENKKTK